MRTTENRPAIALIRLLRILLEPRAGEACGGDDIEYSVAGEEDGVGGVASGTVREGGRADHAGGRAQNGVSPSELSEGAVACPESNVVIPL